MSNLTESPSAWLARQFEFEYCAECGGDACDHVAVPFMGNWFARCKDPIPESADYAAEIARRIAAHEMPKES